MSSIRVLGFDFGLKRIGVATGNSNTKTCQALSTVRSNQGTPDWHALDRIIDEWRPHQLVVGLPLSMNGDESEMSGLARKFGASLTNRYQLDVNYVDERLSSLAADDLLKESTPIGKKGKSKQSGARDNLAAQLILETYFGDNKSWQK